VQLYPQGEIVGVSDGSEAWGIDNRGRIAGTINFEVESGYPILRAAVWKTPTEYFVLSDQSSTAVDINETGDVIGHLIDDETHTSQAAIWKIHTPRVTREEVQRTLTAGFESLLLCLRR
jgi:hypothetical protein